MKTLKTILAVAPLVLGGLTMASAQGSAFTYQGILNDGTNPANGNYEILFRPFGVFTGGSQLTIPNIRFVAVTNGLFTTTMDFGPAIFDGSPRYLQLEVRTNGGASYTTLTPRQPLTPTPYAIFSGTAGTVLSGAIGSSQLANNISLGTTTNNGRLDVYRTAANTAAISLVGSSSQISTYGDAGEITAWLGSSGTAGGFVQLYQANGNIGVHLDGDSTGTSGGGSLGVRASDGSTAVFLSGNASGGGGVYARNSTGNNRAFLAGQSTGGGGGLTLYDGNGTSTVELNGAENSTTGSQLVMKQGNGTTTIQLDAEVGTGGGGYLRLYKGDGTTGLTLQADVNGESKITTQVLQITGGADLSEQFEIKAANETPQPGMIVCIDPETPGQLITSSKAYDRTVAGVMSGAGGVKPGMLMGQQGTAADGKHPVALTGRVYCEADASNGPIHPGDLLTTSNTPGHAMRVTDYPKAHGAIIGKAMSSLDKGQGLVLVLVSLQ